MSALLAVRLACAAALIAAILVAAHARAPRRATAPAELRRLVGAALILYGVGVISLVASRPTVATFAFAAGVAISALAAWLSRGVGGSDGGSDDPPGGPPEQPVGPSGPPDHARPWDPPDGGHPAIDWERFDRAREQWSSPRRPPARH